MNRIKRRVAPLLVLLLVSCATIPLHPGALNKADSVAFDALIVAQAVIEQARTEDAGEALHPSLKPALNRLIESYNLGRAGWLTYRAAVKAKTPADVAAMSRLIDNVTLALNAFQRERPIP